MIPKSPRYLNPHLLKLAKEMPCMICGIEDGTIVMAHSNFAIHGKAKGMKAHDCFVAALCHKHHTDLDSGVGSREDKLETFRRAMEATWLYMWTHGMVVVF